MKQGFTVTELIISISILGFLTLIAVPGFVKKSNSAKISRVQRDLSKLRSALTLYTINEAPKLNSRGNFSVGGDGVVTDYTIFSKSFYTYYSKWRVPSLPPIEGETECKIKWMDDTFNSASGKWAFYELLRESHTSNEKQVPTFDVAWLHTRGTVWAFLPPGAYNSNINWALY